MTSLCGEGDQIEAEVNKVRNEVKLATLRVGTALYAIDILRIKEVIRPVKVSTVPDSPPFIEGVINLRGVVIPVVDLRRRFALPAVPDGRSTRMVICAAFRRLFALVVDEVVEVRSYVREELQPAPRFFQGQQTDIFLGVAHCGDELLMILDLERFFSLSHVVDFLPSSGAMEDHSAVSLS